MGSGIKGKDSGEKFFTIEFFGVSIIIFSLLSMLCLIFGQNILFEVGAEIQYFFLGMFGYFAYPFLFTLFCVGFMLLLGKKPKFKQGKKKVVILILLLVCVLCLFTVITNSKTPKSFSDYLYSAFISGRKGLSGVVVGGVLFSLISYPIVKYLTFVGAITVLSSIILLILIIAFDKFKKSKNDKSIENQNGENDINGLNQKDNSNNGLQPNRNDLGYDQKIYAEQNSSGYNGGYNGYTPNPNYNAELNRNQRQNFGYQGFNGQGVRNDYSNQESPYLDGPSKEEARRILFGNSSTYSSQYRSSFVEESQKPVSYEKNVVNDYNNDMVSSPISKENPIPHFIFNDVKEEEPKIEVEKDISNITYDYEDDFDSQNSILDSGEVLDNYDSENLKSIEIEPESVEENLDNEVYVESPKTNKKVITESVKEVRKIIENMPSNYRYKAPPISIFKSVDNTSSKYELELFNLEVKDRILSTLKTFGVETEIANVYNGPAVSRFDVVIPQDIPMSKVVKLQNDINLRIAAKSEIRMIAPVPNTSYVGIEVPNKIQEVVSIKDIVTSNDFQNAKPNTLTFALGKDVIGRPICLDLADMPHVLVSGTTGSGKSVCLNTMILSLISRYSPQELRFVIVDPKRVDLEPFKVIPHMMFGDIIEDVPTTNAMLTWAVNEMEERYKILQASRSKNIKDYNIKAKERGDKIMPRIVIIIDEFADIMLQDKKGVGVKVCAIAQKARASGIHLVLAAQRPSADIIDGPIKSNLPSRLVFKASSWQDSMTSLGEMGAEKLLGKGDCLYKTTNMYAVDRVMGAYVSDDEMYDIIDYVVENNECYFDLNNWEKITASVSQSQYSGGETLTQPDGVSGNSANNNGVDELYIRALKLGYEYDGLSGSFLERKLAVGYNKGARIMDWLIEQGYLSEQLSNKKRKVILPREEFERLYGDKKDDVEE